MGEVLVLNATYEPLSVVSVKRAIVLLLKEKAELVEAAEARLRSENLTLPVPLVKQHNTLLPSAIFPFSIALRVPAIAITVLPCR